MQIGERLRRLRQGAGLTLEQVGARLHVSKQTVQRYETGEIAHIPAGAIERMAALYGVVPAYIMGWQAGAAEEEKAFVLDSLAALPQQGRQDAAEYIQFLLAKYKVLPR